MVVRLSYDLSRHLTSLGYLTEWDNNKDMKKSESRNVTEATVALKNLRH